MLFHLRFFTIHPAVFLSSVVPDAHVVSLFHLCFTRRTPQNHDLHTAIGLFSHYCVFRVPLMIPVLSPEYSVSLANPHADEPAVTYMSE